MSNESTRAVIEASPSPPSAPNVPIDWLMRRILSGHFRPNRSLIFQEGAFIPGKNDDTGISLSRRKSDANPDFITPEQLKAACTHPVEANRLNCGVVQLPAGIITGAGLSINPDALAEDPGHCLIPEINFHDWKDGGEQSRGQIRKWITKLVEWLTVNQNDCISIRPTPQS